MVTGAGRRRVIGGAICRALARRGADVFFAHWNEGENESKTLLEELRSAGVWAESLELGLSPYPNLQDGCSTR